LESATVGTDEEDVTPLSLPPAVEDWKGNSPTTSELEATLPDVGGVPLLPGAGVLAEAPLLLQPCSVIEVLEPLLASARTIAQERNLTLHADLPPNLPLVEANVQALREVCNNLIENALKYTNPGGQIWVQCQLGSDEQSRESWVEISVSDTGPGISSEDLPHIFERRFRGAQAQSGIPGSGLGLSIARALVEQMHGTIQVSSPAWMPRSEDSSYDLSYNEAAKIGPGTRFTARLPAIREQ
jgi:signal transduction histidine kinase